MADSDVALNPIEKFFSTFDCDDSVREGTDWIQIVHPEAPTEEYNLRYRNNFEITDIKGIRGLNTRDIVTEASSFRDGVNVKGSRLKEGEIEITLRIDARCDCAKCYERELYALIDGDIESDCCPCVVDGELCFDRYELPSYQHLILRLRCCGMVRDFQVQRTGDVRHTRAGTSNIYRIKFLTPTPFNYFPAIQRYTFDLSDIVGTSDSVSFNENICINYLGNVPVGPKIEVTAPVTNLAINGDNYMLNLNRQSTFYEVCGCAPALMDFQSYRQNFRAPNGGDLYRHIAKGSASQVRLKSGMNNINISGINADPATFKVVFTWFETYKGFVSCRPDELCEEFDPSCPVDSKIYLASRI